MNNNIAKEMETLKAQIDLCSNKLETMTAEYEELTKQSQEHSELSAVQAHLDAFNNTHEQKYELVKIVADKKADENAMTKDESDGILNILMNLVYGRVN